MAVISRDGQTLADWLGDSEMAKRVLEFNWSDTPLGPIERWSVSLTRAVAMCLRSRFQMAICWGPALIAIYNDAEGVVLAGQHPWALGRSAREVMSEAWGVIGPQFQAVLDRGEACWSDAQPLPRNRRGRVETYYVTYSISPILDDDGTVGGVLLISLDSTARVLEQRRIGALRELRARSIDAQTAGEACELATRAVTGGPDVPLAAVYLIDDDGRRALCAGASCAGRPLTGLRPVVELEDPIDEASALFRELATDRSSGQLVDSPMFLASGAPERGAARHAYVAALARGAADPVDGFLVAAVSDEVIFDEPYRDFLDRVRIVLGDSVTAARERARERQRAQEIAALEQAKTAVFNNASHELRTPLALILGQIEQLEETDELTEPARERLRVARRSAMRMIKLVNTLLDFSRIEAGEQLGAPEETDVAQLTRDVVAMFRSTVERAGLRLSVDCPSLSCRPSVDAEAWERILCNLLSNSVKFTPAGEIHVGLHAEDGHLCLVVRDTGIGIAQDDLQKVFSRFYRGADPRARTHEGSGIGLALVRELVRFHGGTIEARSQPGQGTRMVVRVPLVANVPAVGVVSQDSSKVVSRRYATLSVAEADGWLAADVSTPHRPVEQQPPARDRIMIVEDNADMRQYLQRLLSPHFHVEVARDGGEAHERIRSDPPSVVVSDVMMPGLDGFALIRELRRDPDTRELPVILVSARADPESRLAALELGADDWIVKPFGARELTTRVRALIDNARVRTSGAATRARTDERARRESELQALLEELKSAQRRIASTRDTERRRIERDLHDGAQQRLMAIRLELGLLGELVERGEPLARQDLDRLRGEFDEALTELRDLAHGLYPPLLASDGLHAALMTAARRAAIPVVLVSEPVRRAPPAIESAAYFCCLEALQNAAKHGGQGARASVALAVRDGALEFRVRDDGAGFDPQNVVTGDGIVNLHDRVAALGGQAEIISRPGEGTTVAGVIPLP